MPSKRVKVRTDFKSGLIKRKAAEGTIFSFRRAAAYIRGIARRLIKRKKTPSTKGNPPHTKRGALKRSIFYAMEGRGIFSRALIGPSFNTVGRVMIGHEYGGTYRGDKFPARPLMTPALEKARERLPKFWRGSIK